MIYLYARTEHKTTSKNSFIFGRNPHFKNRKPGYAFADTYPEESEQSGSSLIFSNGGKMTNSWWICFGCFFCYCLCYYFVTTLLPVCYRFVIAPLVTVLVTALLLFS